MFHLAHETSSYYISGYTGLPLPQYMIICLQYMPIPFISHVSCVTSCKMFHVDVSSRTWNTHLLHLRLYWPAIASVYDHIPSVHVHTLYFTCFMCYILQDVSSTCFISHMKHPVITSQAILACHCPSIWSYAFSACPYPLFHMFHVLHLARCFM